MTMAWIPLRTLAHARSGDKGDDVNIGIIARQKEWHPLLRNLVTPEWLGNAWSSFVAGSIVVYDVPGIGAVNCILHNALDGGGTVSLRTDAQGKSMGQAILTVRVSIEVAEAEELGIPLVGASLDSEGLIPVDEDSTEN